MRPSSFQLVALLLLAPAAEGDERPRLAFRVEITAGASDAALSGSTFSGSGTIGGNAQTTTIATTGRTLGVDHVALTTLGVHFQFGFLPHVALGLSLAALWQSARLGTNTVAAQFDGNFSGLQFGPELSTFWRARWIEARASLAFGDRSLWLPVVGFDRVLCSSRKGYYFGCNPNASNSDFFVEPRLTIGIMPTRVLSFGGYVGGDVMPSGGWTAGAFFAVSTFAWSGHAAARR